MPLGHSSSAIAFEAGMTPVGVVCKDCKERLLATHLSRCEEILDNKR